jgi:hypothetical protein
MCCFLVSGFLTEITQQIHSLRASGVMSSHAARAAESEVRALRKSGGTLCRAPPEIPVLAIEGILPIMSHTLRQRRCLRVRGEQLGTDDWPEPELIQLLRIASVSPPTRQLVGRFWGL